MKNKKLYGFVSVVMFLAVFCGVSYGMELLNDQQALKEMFPDAEKIVTEKKVFTEGELAAVKVKLGGFLTYRQADAKARNEYELFYCIKNGKKIGVAIIEEQPAKWGPVKYIIALDSETGKVKNLAVMSYTEKRGRPIARRNFLEQFVNKGSEIALGKGINAVSGATVSSDATCFAVKKVVVLYEETVLNKKK